MFDGVADHPEVELLISGSLHPVSTMASERVDRSGPSHNSTTVRHAARDEVFLPSIHRTTLAGIVPPGFYGDGLCPDPPDFWLPLATEPVLREQNALLNHAGDNWLYVIGRR